MTADPVTRLVDLPDSVLYCLRGARGHAWDEFQPLARRTSWGQPLDVRCLRCGKTRRDVYDSLGAVSYRSYDPAVGYPGFPFVEAHTADDVRREVVRRARARPQHARIRLVQ